MRSPLLRAAACAMLGLLTLGLVSCRLSDPVHFYPIDLQKSGLVLPLDRMAAVSASQAYFLFATEAGDGYRLLAQDLDEDRNLGNTVSTYVSADAIPVGIGPDSNDAAFWVLHEDGAIFRYHVLQQARRGRMIRDTAIDTPSPPAGVSREQYCDLDVGPTGDLYILVTETENVQGERIDVGAVYRRQRGEQGWQRQVRTLDAFLDSKCGSLAVDPEKNEVYVSHPSGGHVDRFASDLTPSAMLPIRRFINDLAANTGLLAVATTGGRLWLGNREGDFLHEREGYAHALAAQPIAPGIAPALWRTAVDAYVGSPPRQASLVHRHDLLLQ